MSKSGEILGEIGFGLLFLYIMYIAFFFLGGHYTNKKIECIKKHESVEARYNIMTGCWYWDEIASKMVKDKNKSKKLDIKSLPTDSDGWKTLPSGIKFREIDKGEVCIQKDNIVNGEQVYISTDGDGRKFKEIDEEKEKREKKLSEQFMKGTI